MADGVDEPWEVVPPRIRAEADEAGVTRARPADWAEPCSLDDGLDWARAMLAEGYYLDHWIDPDEGVVWFKLWEHGDDEPSWGDVILRASSRRQARPVVTTRPERSRGSRWLALRRWVR